MIYQIRKGIFETNSSTLHQFTICYDAINTSENKPEVKIRFEDELLTDHTYTAKTIQDRLNVIVSYAISEMIGCIINKENMNFKAIRSWLISLFNLLINYVTFKNPLFYSTDGIDLLVYGTYNKHKYLSEYLPEEYECPTIASEMFMDDIIRTDIDAIVKFIMNDRSFYYQEDHADWDPDGFPNSDNVYTIYREE